MSETASYRLLAADTWRRSNDPADSDFGPELLAQTLADAERCGVLRALAWLQERGHHEAATDMAHQWNDPGQPGDGSCVPLEARGER